MADPNIIKAIAGAIREGNKQAFQKYITGNEANVRAGEMFGSWLHVAADYGQLEIVKSLVEGGWDFNLTNEEEESSCLLLAVRGGKTDVVAYLLAKGAVIDLTKPEYNPLFAAISGGNSEIARMLIDAGIDTTKTYRGTSGKLKDALSYANDWGRKDIAAMIETARGLSAQSQKSAAGTKGPGTSKKGGGVSGDLLSVATSEGIAAFQAAVNKFPREKFYAFCFYTDSDLSFVYPHANTLESLARVDSGSDPNYFRWAPAEWQLDFGQYGDAEFMSATNQHLREQLESGGDFAATKRKTIETLTQALRNIRNSPVFRDHADEEQLAFWVNIGDASSGEIEWMFEPVIDHLPADIVKQLRALFEFKAKRKAKR